MYLNISTTAGNKTGKGLTLTWDVFKWFKRNLTISSSCRLTLTWDVFKYC